MSSSRLGTRPARDFDTALRIQDFISPDGASVGGVDNSGVLLGTGVNVTGTVQGTGLAGSLLSSSNPAALGAAAPGSSAVPARSDHVHPTTGLVADTGNQNVGGLKTFTSLITGSAGATITGAKTTLAASVAGYASANLPHGSAPSSPADGDVWTTTAGLYVRVNGVTIGPISTNGPATSVTTLDGLNSGVVGTATKYAREDHEHALTGLVDTSSQQTVAGAKTFTGALGVTLSGVAADVTITDTGATGASVKMVGDGGTTPSKTLRVRAGVLRVMDDAVSTEILSLTNAGLLTVPSATVTGLTTATGGLKVGTYKVSVQGTTPGSPSTGDVWLPNSG